MDTPTPSTISKWTRFCERHGLAPVGKAELPDATVYVAEQQRPGIVVSLDPIESQTHYVVAWALETNVNGAPEMTFGRSVMLRAMDVPFQNMRIKAALHDAAKHVKPSGRRYAH